MIKKLRIKIVMVITVILTLTVAAIMTAINIVSQRNNQGQIESRLQRIADNDGFMPVEYDDLDPYHDAQSGYMDSFSVQLDYFYEVKKIILSRDIVVHQDIIIEYANKALESGKKVGELGSYAYMVQSKQYGRIIVFMDVKPYQQANENLFFTTLIIGISAVVFFFVISIILAGWLVKPVKTTFDKQKLFISNASHELKTPLAVISANTDVLESEIGDNKWLGYIRSETVRMSELVNELLCLARLEDKSGHKLNIAEVDLTNLVMQTVLPFESTVFEMGKKLCVEAQPGVTAKCDASSIKHVITILIDNAVKYSNEHGAISVKLYTRSNKKIIEIYNTGEGVPKDKLDKIFERFYRQDEARNSKSGGYGLGLAIAKAGVEAHGGKIFAESEPGAWIKFTVIL